jgi:hypothetical protein
MRLWVKILLLMLIFVAGIITGFFLAPSYLNQIKIIGQTATIIQYPAIIGVALVVWRMIADWLKENVLEYDGIYTKKQIYVNTNTPHYNLIYYLRIKKKRGRGRVENCEGRIIFGERDMMTVWDGDVPYIAISMQGDLRLFENFQSDHSNESHLIFHSNPTQSGIQKTMISYSDGILDKEILVRIGCEGNANLPSKPFIRTIGQIIAQANE